MEEVVEGLGGGVVEEGFGALARGRGEGRIRGEEGGRGGGGWWGR